METSDQYCTRIFAYLFIKNRKLRFNKLYKELNTIGAKMTKPTLLLHLRHLEKDEFILKKEESKQNVTYETNSKKFEQLKKAIEYKKIVQNNIKNKKIFKSMSLEHQIGYVTNVLTMEQLLNLHLCIGDNIDPKHIPEHRFAYALIRNLFDNYTRWLLETCKESKETNEKALTLTDNGIRNFLNLLLVPPETMQG